MLLPAWFGCGAALGDAIDAGDEAAELIRGLRSSARLLDNLEMTLAKSRLRDRARVPRPRPAGARSRAAVPTIVAEEHARALDAVLLILRVPELLERQPVLRRSID